MGERDDKDSDGVVLARMNKATTIGGQIKQRNDMIDCEDGEKMNIRTVRVYGGICDRFEDAMST